MYPRKFAVVVCVNEIYLSFLPLLPSLYLSCLLIDVVFQLVVGLQNIFSFLVLHVVPSRIVYSTYLYVYINVACMSVVVQSSSSSSSCLMKARCNLYTSFENCI